MPDTCIIYSQSFHHTLYEAIKVYSLLTFPERLVEARDLFALDIFVVITNHLGWLKR